MNSFDVDNVYRAHHRALLVSLSHIHHEVNASEGVMSRIRIRRVLKLSLLRQRLEDTDKRLNSLSLCQTR